MSVRNGIRAIKRRLLAPWMIIAIVIIVVTGTLPILFTPSSHNYNTIDEFKDILREMETDFPLQHDYWSMLRNDGVQHLIKVYRGYDSDRTPLSYLVAGYAGSKRTVDCFVSRLTSAYTNSKPIDHQYIDSVQFIGRNNKAKVYEVIQSKLGGKNKFVVVNNIEKLNFKVVQMFTSYEDSNNTATSYPQTIILYTTELPFSYDPSRRKDDEVKAANHFKSNVWGNAHVDHAAELWSRMGSSLLLIREELAIPSCFTSL